MIPDRPSVHDAAVAAAVASKLLPEALSYLGEEADPKGEVESNLRSVLEDAIEFDGYKLARELEREFYWDSDEQLVDVMGGAGHHAYDICSKLVREWVKENNIQPGHKVGDPVEWNKFKKFWKEMKRGVIVEVRADEGVYVIQEDGTDYSPKIPPHLPESAVAQIREMHEKHKPGWIVDFEQVTGDQPWCTAERHSGKTLETVGS